MLIPYAPVITVNDTRTVHCCLRGVLQGWEDLLPPLHVRAGAERSLRLPADPFQLGHRQVPKSP